MNLLFSYSANTDHQFAAEGHRFLGAGADDKGSEVHVFLKKDEAFAESAADETSCRKRKPCRMVGDEPFSQAELDARIDAICGCEGKYDCDCVSVSNQAKIELWTEYNTKTDAR